MPMVEVPTPFGNPVDEVPLSNPPLIAVVAQVRFPPIASIAREEFIGPFQERIRADYPVLRQEREVNVVLTPEGVRSGGDSGLVWRFLDRSHQPDWKVSLASSFVALDTSRYESREDFLNRLRSVLVALDDTVRPATCDRIGVRYVDQVRLSDPEIELRDLVKPPVLGVSTVDPGSGAELVHSLSDTEFRLQDATLHGRWGQVPAKTQLDPLHGGPIDAPSWILDLDMYTLSPGDFDVAGLTATAATFAERIYRFFRWAVKPALLQRYGGEV